MENKWEMLESSNEDREKIWKKNRTFAGDLKIMLKTPIVMLSATGR